MYEQPDTPPRAAVPVIHREYHMKPSLILIICMTATMLTGCCGGKHMRREREKFANIKGTLEAVQRYRRGVDFFQSNEQLILESLHRAGVESVEVVLFDVPRDENSGYEFEFIVIEDSPGRDSSAYKHIDRAFAEAGLQMEITETTHIYGSAMHGFARPLTPPAGSD